MHVFVAYVLIMETGWFILYKRKESKGISREKDIQCLL